MKRIVETRNQATSTSMFEPLEGRQMFSAGDLDPTFGVGGKLLGDVVPFTVAHVVMQPDGKFVAAGYKGKDMAVARLNANGTLDATFGNGTGFVTTDFKGEYGEYARQVAIQNDGKIVVAGYRENQDGITVLNGDKGNMSVARYNIDGSLDKTFDKDGKVGIDFGTGTNEAHALAIQNDGKIVVAGWHRDDVYFDDDEDFAVARLTTSGKLDGTFGSRIPNSTLRSGMLLAGFGGEDHANSIALTPDGKIVVAGNTDVGKARFAVARFHPNGDFDKGFDNDGKASVDFPVAASLSSVAVARTGEVVLGGTASGDFTLVRLNSAGKLDAYFAGVGKLRDMTDATDSLSSVVVTGNGEILAAGKSDGQFLIARYRYNGALETAFGKGGRVSTAFGGEEGVNTLTSNPDGTITAIGAQSDRKHLVAARYLSNGLKVGVFSLDDTASEAGVNNAKLIFTRDQRVDYTTRVYYTLSGSATWSRDYAGLDDREGGVHYVDIYAGQTYAEQTLMPVLDTEFEGTETAKVSIVSTSRYTLDPHSTQDLTIFDDDALKVNFQTAAQAAPVGYVPDFGNEYAYRGNGLTFGWDANNTANARIRGNPRSGDLRLDSLNHMQKDGANRKWELAVTNGMYEVTLVAGDPDNSDSIYKMTLENSLAVQGTPTGAIHWFKRTINVQVNDGKLTLANAAGSLNNKICYIDIKCAAPGTVAGPVTNNIPLIALNPIFNDIHVKPIGGVIKMISF